MILVSTWWGHSPFKWSCISITFVITLFWKKCEDEIHTPEIGTWESYRIPETSEFNCRGQNTSHWSVFYIIEKLLKCRCRKWPRIDHLDICSTSYGKKKGRESNWQFDFWPLKVKNRPDLGVCRLSVTHLEKLSRRTTNFLQTSF